MDALLTQARGVRQVSATDFCKDFQANYLLWDTTRKDMWNEGPERLAEAATDDPKAADLRLMLTYFRTAVNKDGGPGSPGDGGLDEDFAAVKAACRAVMDNDAP